MLSWLAKEILVPLVLNFFSWIYKMIQKALKRKAREKKIDEEVKAVEDAKTPEEQENAARDLIRSRPS